MGAWEPGQPIALTVCVFRLIGQQAGSKQRQRPDWWHLAADTGAFAMFVNVKDTVKTPAQIAGGCTENPCSM